VWGDGGLFPTLVIATLDQFPMATAAIFIGGVAATSSLSKMWVRANEL
jgi:hypothetical protein